MTATTSWAWQPVYHPWFNKPTMKRRTHNDSDDDDTLPSAARTSKRRRFDELEHGFADLSLVEQPQPRFFHPEQQPERSFFPFPPGPSTTSNAPPDTDAQHPVQDVQMSFSTWYEPEKDRIVITSLDDSDVEADEPKPVSDVSISSALLDRIKLQPTSNLLPSPRQATECQALVLYRPLVPSLETTKSDAKPDQWKDSSVVVAETSPIPVDDDAMDVEP